ncbi:MAG: entericidin A/B family lipoprotein [Sphingomonas oligoaromativorans]|nr:entericidin A/B family lipoprotein [Sphingomonas oligoaromativorans]NIJ33823.1 putative small secreted protein [Sphingomonas oligoaromativorans]
MVRKLIGAGLISAALLVTACNTIHGAGKDVSSAGNAVANAADNAK